MTNEELIKKYVDKSQWDESFKKLESGIPVQYIIGNVDFYGNVINVDERVLIPRFETENLVAKTINYAKKIFSNSISIVDLGTGSGCIAITLKKELDSRVVAIDISQDALNLAKENAVNNNVEIEFKLGNMREILPEKYDLIISNPPYIPNDGFVAKIVRDNEPNLALFAEDNGLFYYKKILSYAFDCLNKPGLIAFEIGDNQKELLEEYLKNNFNEIKYQFETDLVGLYRYLFIFNE